MSGYPLAWLPPFLVGLCAAVASEASVGLLLYSGGGFMRALTLVLATLLGSLGLGLWTAPSRASADLAEAARLRWLLLLVSFSAAALTAGAWSVLGGLAEGALTRGMGLALLAGMPLFGVGSVLGALSAAEEAYPGRVAVAAALGGAVGAVLTGGVLLGMTVPLSMYLFCLVVLSGGALIHGRVLDRRPADRVVDEEDSVYGRVRVVDHADGPAGWGRRSLEVKGRLRGGHDGLTPLRPWEGAALELLGADLEDVPGAEAARGGPSGAVLVVGAGAAHVITHLLDRGVATELVEPNAAVRRMAVRHLGLPATAEGLVVREEDLRDVLLDGAGPFQVVVADAGGLIHEEVPVPSHGLQAGLLAALMPGGLVLLGGDAPGDDPGSPRWEALTRRLDPAWSVAAVYVHRDPKRPGSALLALAREERRLPASIGDMVGSMLDVGGGAGPEGDS